MLRYGKSSDAVIKNGDALNSLHADFLSVIYVDVVDQLRHHSL